MHWSFSCYCWNRLLNHTRCAGHELVMLGKALPGRQLFGTDLAAGMVDLADQKLTQAGLR